jgi:phosphonate transport system permease protein
MSRAVQQIPKDQFDRLHGAYNQALYSKNRMTAIGLFILILLLASSFAGSEVDVQKFIRNIWRFPNYFYEITPKLSIQNFFGDIAEWFWGINKWLRQLGETLLIAYVGTITGAIIAFCLSFLSSRNMAISKWSQIFSRRLLEFLRTVPEIVFALIFVVSFGLGPLPGVLALTFHTAGALGKLFSEIIENIDAKPVEGVRASGGSWFHQVRYGAVPQVIANFTSYSLLRFEINVRGAAVMGFVGAGGIGQTLIEYIRKFYYSDVSAVLILIILTVMVIDTVTEKIRHAFIGTLER